MTRRKFIKTAAGIFVPVTFGILLPRKSAAQQILLSGGGSVDGGATATAPSAGGGGASFAFVNKNHNVEPGASATSTVQLTGVTAGNLIIVGQKSEGAGEGAITGISDGTSSFSLATETEHGNGDVRWRFGYLLTSVASGTVTYTVTRSNALAAFFWTFAMEFSGGGTRAFDAENGASGTSTSVNSGNITTGASVALVLGGYAHYNAVTLSSIQIGGVNKDGCEPTTPGSSESAMWYRILSSVMTNGAATGSISSSEWVSRILSIKAT